jgi:hypothetical protein
MAAAVGPPRNRLGLVWRRHMPPIYLVVVVPRYVRVWDCGEQGQGDVATGVVRLLGVE